MSFIDHMYFVNDINIPFEDSNGIAIARIMSAITRFEEECLRALLGDKLYDAFIAGLAATPPILSKWTDLRDGKAFDIVINGVTVTKTWKGLTGGTAKKSLIAFYTYAQYRSMNETFFSGVVQAKGKSENSEVADAASVICTAYNNFVKLYGQMPVYYPETPYAPTANTFLYDEPSAYNFLMANITTYTDWRFTPKQMKNEFGI